MFNDTLLKALKGEPTSYTPVWFMRQAGRALSAYRDLRERYRFHELSTHPEAIVTVTLLPVKHLDVDAAILFADLTTPLKGMGVEYEIVEGKGPVISNPLRDEKRIAQLRIVEPEYDMAYLLEAIRALKAELEVPLIGFIGAPFTLATYLIEGKGGRDHPFTRAMMYGRPDLWQRLMKSLSENLLKYAKAQVKAGVDVIQIFDSWLGSVPVDVFRKRILPYVCDLIRDLQQDVPVIYFGTQTSELLKAMAETGARAIGVDWRVRLNDAWARIGYDRAIQGNLDPAVLLTDLDIIYSMTDEVLKQADNRPGHIFNLGHGVLPQTKEIFLRKLVDYVHEKTVRNQSPAV